MVASTPCAQSTVDMDRDTHLSGYHSVSNQILSIAIPVEEVPVSLTTCQKM